MLYNIICHTIVTSLNIMSYHAKELAMAILDSVRSPKDPCPDIGFSYALFRNLREESMKKLPPRDTKPTYMEKVHTLPTFSHPYAEKNRHGSSALQGNYGGRKTSEIDLGKVTGDIYKGISSSSGSSSTSSYRGVGFPSSSYGKAGLLGSGSSYSSTSSYL